MWQFYAVVHMADLGIGIFLSTDVHTPPAVEVVGEGSGADLAEAVDFGKVFYFYYGITHKLLINVTLNEAQRSEESGEYTS